MIARAALVASLLLAIGCGQNDAAPPVVADGTFPEVLYVVHQEVRSIRLDGTNERSLGRVGDDKHRTGSPRWLPDGRAAVLADDTGGIYPFVASHDGVTWTPVGHINVTLNDALCGVALDGEPRLIYTLTPFLPTNTTLRRADLESGEIDSLNTMRNGVIQDPAPYDDGRVVAIRATSTRTTIEIFDVSGPANHGGPTEVLATIDAPYYAMWPARMTDGRVAFVHVDSRDPVDDLPSGEIWYIGLGGELVPTGLTGVQALVAAGDKIVYERISTTGMTDLMSTSLDGLESANVTNTPYVNEHLTWSD